MFNIKSIITKIEYSIYKVLEEVGIFEYKDYFNTDLLVSHIFQDLSKLVEKDPAAKCHSHVIDSYLSFQAVLYYRVANMLHYYQANGESEHSLLKTKARQISESAKRKTGIEIHPAACIGKSFVIDHGMGTVIGETVTIGNNCYILQGVILGAIGISENKNSIRHPQIGNDVEIGGFAKILGNLTVGDNVFICPNSVVIDDVPSNTKVKIVNQLQVSSLISKHITVTGLKLLNGFINIYGSKLTEFTEVELILTYKNGNVEIVECEVVSSSDCKVRLRPKISIDKKSSSVEVLLKCSGNTLVSIKDSYLLKGAINEAA